MSLAVFCGRVRLGTIREDDAGEFVALGLDERMVGRFRSRSEAIAALPDRPPSHSPSAPARRVVHDGGPAAIGEA